MNKKLTFAALAILLLGSAPAYSHPADSIAVEYDSSQYFKVSVHHPVRGNLAGHRISRVVVKLNGTEVIRQSFARQHDAEWQQAGYLLIDLKPGHKIEVTAYCNVFGSCKRMFVPLPLEEGQ